MLYEVITLKLNSCCAVINTAGTTILPTRIGGKENTANIANSPVPCKGKTMESSLLNIFQHMQTPEIFAAGKTVFVEGEPGYIMYVVLEGHVKICVGGRTLEVAGPGRNNFV